MSSILTNTSALVALQTLKSINAGMGKVQNEVSTGLKVATAKDNSSTWSIASTMRSDVKTFGKLVRDRRCRPRPSSEPRAPRPSRSPTS